MIDHEARELRIQASFDRQANNYLPADAKYAPHTPIDVEDKFIINVLVERLHMDLPGIVRKCQQAWNNGATIAECEAIWKGEVREICVRWYEEF